MIWLPACSKQEQVGTAVLTTGNILLLCCRLRCLLLSTLSNMTDAFTLSWWKRNQRCCLSTSQIPRTCDNNKTQIHSYMCIHVCEWVLWAYVSSCMRWFDSGCVCVCAVDGKRENGRLRQSLGVSYRDSVALDLCCLCSWCCIADLRSAV